MKGLIIVQQVATVRKLTSSIAVRVELFALTKLQLLVLGKAKLNLSHYCEVLTLLVQLQWGRT